jgi:hypothetical protein
MGLGSRQPDVDSGPDSDPLTWHICRRGLTLSLCRLFCPARGAGSQDFAHSHVHLIFESNAEDLLHP